MADKLISAKGPRGLLWACIAPETKFTEPEVSDSRLMAALRPYRDEGAAWEALVNAGCVIEDGGER